MRVHHLSCGTMCPFGGGFMDGRSGGLTSRARLVCHVLAIETDRAGLVLVDTGFGLADVARPTERLGKAFPKLVQPVLDEAETAARQIELLGFSRDDVRHIVPTHMDLDHVGGLSDFPHATVHLMRDEHRAATDPPTAAEKQRYRAIQWAHDPKFETYDPTGEPWNGFAAARALRGLPAEILLVPLIGHSRGHAAVVVETGKETLVHAGDAYFHEGEMQDPPRCPGGLTAFQNLLAWNGSKMRENKGRLRRLARELRDDVVVFSAHDAAELERARDRAAQL